MPIIKAGGGFPGEIDPEVEFNNELTQDRQRGNESRKGTET